MKSLNMIRATKKFQAIIDRYQRNNNNKILYQKKLKNSLNNLFLQDLNQVRKHKNFSDEEYMINEIKYENKIKNDKSVKNNDNFTNSPEINSSNEKITKDIFFYYRDKINEKNGNNKQSNNNNLNLRYNSASRRLNSGKTSDISINTSQTKNTNKTKSNASLILPIIYSRNYQNKIYKNNNSKSFISDDDTIINIINYPQPDKNIQTEISEDINNDLSKNEKEKNNLFRYKVNSDTIKRRNNSNTLNVDKLLRKIKKEKQNIFYRVQLPFILENDIYNKISKVTQKSENISKNINYISTEGNLAYENELNRIKFLNDLING